MKIEHLGLYVHDLEGAKRFFETYFQAQANTLYHNPKTGFSSYFMSFSQGARLEIMTRNADLHDVDRSDFPTGYHHLAISLGSKEKVDALTEELRSAGYNVLSGPRTTGDGYYESLVQAFEGNLLELTI